MSRRVLLGVTGSIAAYKAAELVRLFVRNGDSVRVVMTPAATKFVSPLTFSTLSRNQVYVEQFEPVQDWRPEHIALSECDIALVAPATANTLAKMRHGIADNLLTSTLLATRAPVFVAPAMNDGMWESASTQENVAVLRARGVVVIGPANGELACGTSGSGRMAPVEEIFKAVNLRIF